MVNVNCLSSDKIRQHLMRHESEGKVLHITAEMDLISFFGDPARDASKVQ